MNAVGHVYTRVHMRNKIIEPHTKRTNHQSATKHTDIHQPHAPPNKLHKHTQTHQTQPPLGQQSLHVGPDPRRVRLQHILLHLLTLPTAAAAALAPAAGLACRMELGRARWWVGWVGQWVYVHRIVCLLRCALGSVPTFIHPVARRHIHNTPVRAAGPSDAAAAVSEVWVRGTAVGEGGPCMYVCMDVDR